VSKKPISSKYLHTIRNIGIIAHIDAGKTTLSERILFYAGRIHRLGEVHEGTATMDFMPEEQERGITIASAVTSCLWRGNSVNLIDTPGHVDFTVEVERSLRVLDGAIGVFCAVSGVEPQSETVWRQSESYHVPKLAFVNKIDRLGADFSGVLESMREKLGIKPLALQVPDGEGAEFRGVFDLVRMERLVFDAESRGVEYERIPLTTAERERLAPWREAMLETLSDTDDGVMNAYLSGQDISPETLIKAIREAVIALKLVPVFLGSALKNVGVQPLMDAVCDYLPGPLEAPLQAGVDPTTHLPKSFAVDPEAPLSALVFKVVMESGRKQSFVRVYSGQLTEGETVFNVTHGCEERVARLFRLHADRREKIEVARAGEIVAAAGMRFGRTGDTLARKDNPILLEQIADYKPVISLAIEPKNADEADKLDEVMQQRWLGVPVVLGHPGGKMLDSDEFVDRVVGTIVATYKRGSELWCVARILDDVTARAIEAGGIADSSPAVLFNPDHGPGAYVDVDGVRMLVEDTPSLCDHLALTPRGVWSKGGEPSGVETTALVEA